jgi:hypothetical protein
MSVRQPTLPDRLSPAEAIDPFAVEPGVLLLGRFCAVENVKYGAETWSVLVSDVERQLGSAPHHRLELHHIPGGARRQAKLRLANAVAGYTQPRVVHWASQPSGDLLLTEACRLPALSLPLGESDTTSLALSLADLLARLHDAGVVGVAFTSGQIRVHRGDVRLTGFEHLVGDGTPEEDVQRLTEVLVQMTGDSLREILRPFSRTARDLLDRVRAMARQPVSLRLAELLPAVPPFVGRDDVLRSLLRHVEMARRGTVQVVALVGEAGVGKSRLLRQLDDEIARSGGALVSAGGFGVEASAHHSGFVGVLDKVARQARRLPEDTQQALIDRVLAATGPLVGLVSNLTPALEQLLGHHEIPPDLHVDEQFVRHAGVLASVLRALGTRESPFVALLDEGQLADRASLAVLRFLQDETTEHHTLVVVSTRTPLAEALENVATNTYPLAPFTTQEAERLLGATLPGNVADRRGLAQSLWRSTRGIPLAMWATIQEWTEDGRLSYDDNTRQWALDGSAGGERVIDLFRHHYKRLTLDARHLALLMSLRPGVVDAAWLGAVTAWAADRVDRGVFWLTARGVAVQDAGGALRVAHGALREMVLRASGPRAQRSAHRQIATWLERDGIRAAASERAWHEEHATPDGVNPDLARLHLTAGVQLLAIYNLERAAFHFAKALLRGGHLDDVRAGATEGQADIELLSGDLNRAFDLYVRAIDLSETGTRAVEIAARAVYGFYRRSAVSSAVDLAAVAMHRIGEPLPNARQPGMFALLRALVALPFATQRPQAERDAMCRIYPVLVAVTASMSPAFAGYCILRAGRQARGLETSSAGVVYAFGAQATSFLSVFSSWFTDVERRLMRRAMDIAAAAKDPWGIGVVHHMRAQLELADGDFENGQSSMDLAVASFARSGDLTVGVLSLLTKVMYGYNRVPVDRLLKWARRASTAANRQGAPLQAAVAASIEAFVLARAGRPSAVEVADDAAQRLDGLAVLGLDVAMASAFLSRANLMLGRKKLAIQYADRGMRHVQGLPQVDFMLEPYLAAIETRWAGTRLGRQERIRLARNLWFVSIVGRRAPRMRAVWLYYTASQLQRRGDLTRALARCREIIETSEKHGEVWLVAKAHAALGQMLGSTDPGRAEQHQATANKLANSLGMVLVADGPTPSAAPSEGEMLDALYDLDNARPTPPDAPNTAPIGAVVHPLVPPLEEALPASIELRCEIDEDTRTHLDVDRIQLLVVNLVFAARDLLPGRGALRMTVGDVSVDATAAVKIAGATPGNYLLIEVQATGTDEAEAHVHGMGVCREVATSLGGFTNVEWTDGAVSLRAWLPTTGASSRPADASNADSEAPAPRGGRRQVYVVHPDPRLRSTVAAALGRMDLDVHDVAERETPPDAVAVFADAATFEAWGDMLPSDVGRVVLYPRSAEAPIGAVASLRVPFTVQELGGVVRREVFRDSSDTE